MKKNIIHFIVLFVTMIVIASPTQAKKDLEDAVDPAALTELKSTVANQGASVATVQNQVNEMVDKFQSMNGDIGRNYNKNRDQDKVINDMTTRLQVLEDQVILLMGQLQELRAEGLMQPKSSQRFKEYTDYARGLEYMNSKEFNKAVNEFTNFMKLNPKSIYQSYAQFWIGEAYYMQLDYPMAIKQYQKLLSSNSKSAKASTALYRQGLSFLYLQSFEDAQAFFSKVIRSYPNSIEAIQASSQLTRIKEILDLKKQQELEMKMVN